MSFVVFVRNAFVSSIDVARPAQVTYCSLVLFLHGVFVLRVLSLTTTLINTIICIKIITSETLLKYESNYIFLLKHSTCLLDQINFQILLSKCVCAMYRGTEGVRYMEPQLHLIVSLLLHVCFLRPRCSKGGGMGEP